MLNCILTFRTSYDLCTVLLVLDYIIQFQYSLSDNTKTYGFVFVQFLLLAQCTAVDDLVVVIRWNVNNILSVHRVIMIVYRMYYKHYSRKIEI